MFEFSKKWQKVKFDFATFLNYSADYEYGKGLEKELDELRFYRGIAVSVVFGVISTLLLSFKTLENMLIYCGIGVAILALFALIPLTLKINDKIREIKEA